MDLTTRTTGILLHPTSLPGPHGIGDLGPEAHAFVDWLAHAGQRVWQMLPLTPAGPGDSPYAGVSAFAGNPLLVSLHPLVERGWLAPPTPPEGLSPSRAVHAVAGPWRMACLRQAFAGFLRRADGAGRAAFAEWCASQARWLDDYALFMALEAAHGGAAWWRWDDALARRVPAALEAARAHLAAATAFWRFVQWCFHLQWSDLHAHARNRGIAILGDVPIYVAHHSVDCWTRPDLFRLDDQLQPVVVAGAPPDAWSADGQRWGNPLYAWHRMAEDGYAWWIERIAHAFTRSDAIRIDHFRGFAAGWEIPADAHTARDGRWQPGPGRALFDAVARALGPRPIVAEDLGVPSPEVPALRDACGFPGMRIVHEGFMFGQDHPFLPHRHVPATVAFTSTHDSNTVRGWFAAAPETQRHDARVYLGADDRHVVEAMIEATSRSVARTVIFPLQDVLDLDASHRMNLPGTSEGNWAWRFDWSMMPPGAAPWLARLSAATGRSGSIDTVWHRDGAPGGR